LLKVASLVFPALATIPRRPYSPPATLKIPDLVVALLVVALLVVALLVVAAPAVAGFQLRISPRNIVRIYHLGGVG
jgi:hypothetical protein